MSSWKRMTLNKTWLADYRNPISKVIPVIPIPIFSNTFIQKEQILVYRYKRTKNTGGVPLSYFFLTRNRYERGSPWAKRGSIVLSKHVGRQVRLEHMFCGLSTHPPDSSTFREIIFYSHSKCTRASYLCLALHHQSRDFLIYEKNPYKRDFFMDSFSPDCYAWWYPLPRIISWAR